MKALMNRGSKGFTLIELLVVIAIIGLLASVVLVSLNTARGRARTASAQQTMRGVQQAMAVCINDVPATAPTLPSETNSGGGGAICSTSPGSTYAPLPTGWVYCDDTISCVGSTTIDPFASATAFEVWAGSADADDDRAIRCTELTCQTFQTDIDIP